MLKLLAVILALAVTARAATENQGPAPQTTASSTANVTVQLGSTNGKTEKHLTFTKNTAAVGATIIGTYTVTTGKTLYVTQIEIVSYLTAISATGSRIGDAVLVTPSGTVISSMTFFNAASSVPQAWVKRFAEPMSVPSATVIMSSAMPSVAGSTNWIMNLDGYEK